MNLLPELGINAVRINSDSTSGDTATVADLRVTKTADVEQASPGSRITWTISVTNNGEGIARNAVVSDVLRTGLEFVSASNGGTASGQTVTWNLGDIAPGQSVDLTLDVRVARPAPASLIDEDGVIAHALYNVKATGHVARIRKLVGLAA